ncbi:type II toxin-antitoxin system mRNA interferase toxin, RelE/StbE family [Patescibacteria group bacterium]|nr:type II toxin-antitoxin system mRNA interferase toxin, RelE/StbE family [Patescibacteria group bacterium]MBU4017105.1 type II toxin-antitoxin system mRNA interferase toxin, RelE/StbE family [Patescibacteria group bacterium]MBU4098279.1 type II toxin-antitoxin system mRNA interferase toxin, RelE/StbE family [Patescibacteria group bacterium]
MLLNYTKNFLKNYNKRIAGNKMLDKKFQKRLQLFLQNPKTPLLKDHKLTGAKKKLRSFSISGDIRVIYYQEKERIFLFDIGTHNQVY